MNEETEIENLLKEFDELPKDLTNDTYMASTIYGDRNRYTNIRSSDNNLIKISTGYINANYILNDQYIATQYPLHNTIDHFWTLVWETNSKTIINLTNDNKYLLRSSKYDIQIKLYESNPVYECRRITMSHNDETKILLHIIFKTWTDFDIPTVSDFEKLMNLIIAGPIIVHCMAGVGRAGTFILAHYLLSMYNVENPINIIKEMRSTRAGMIQSREQFKFAITYTKTVLNNKKSKRNHKKKLRSSCGLEHAQEKLNLNINPLSLSQDNM